VYHPHQGALYQQIRFCSIMELYTCGWNLKQFICFCSIIIAFLNACICTILLKCSKYTRVLLTLALAFWQSVYQELLMMETAELVLEKQVIRSSNWQSYNTINTGFAMKVKLHQQSWKVLWRKNVKQNYTLMLTYTIFQVKTKKASDKLCAASDLSEKDL
jgi:hypothetical protein